MTEKADVQARPRRSASVYLAGRASRREYWIMTAGIFALSLLIAEAVPAASTGLTVALAFIQLRRLHDFGRSGWWALGAATLPLVALLLWGSVTEDLILTLGFLVQAVLVVLIGAIPGDPAENRFGPPPPFNLRRVLTGR
jgi:uncharacterized membrane protein YhaH (DUF805 family)